MNITPTLSIQNVALEEAWSGRKLGVDQFRIFEYIVYVHILDEKRKKLDNKGEKYIFICMSSISKTYKLYFPSTMKLVISRDMVFDEKIIWS